MYKLFHGDCLEFMKSMDAESIDLTVTSPPYDNLRKYNGYTFDFEPIAQELYRVTKPGGVVVWVVGDQTINGSETGTSFRQALYFMELGFNLHDTMIYAKTNPITLNHNRYEPSFEYMFIFSNGKPKTFNPIKKPCKMAGDIYTLDRDGYCKTNTGTARRIRQETTKTNDTKIHENIFYYSIGGDVVEHPAPFPEALARDHILSWSNKGDLVFDPFTGSGTTGKMAIMYGRDFVGSEISEEYCAIAEKRIHDASQQMLLPLDI